MDGSQKLLSLFLNMRGRPPMLWRLFIIWSRDKRVIYFPIVVLSIGAVNCGLIITYDALATNRFQNPSFVATYNGLAASALAIDMLLTWYLTGLICYRLWSVERQKRVIGLETRSTESDRPKSRYGKIMVALIQSGMFYSLTEASLFCCILAGNHDGQDVINSMNTRTIGITTVLIILQLNTGAVGNNNQHVLRTAPSAFSMPVFRVKSAEDCLGSTTIDVV
ncbi:hypothetical protein FRB94_000523 [Tulasnella sp. JGI-2019a]|nr:hypothetical protein FRB94_000523 [Tulasnella sp. JGI-2019a]KAG8994689.1 hypothetical protein FRB93_001490 [Tulasnella sp. JGI-2019a]